MRSTPVAGACAVVCYLAALLTLAPATLLDPLLASLSHQRTALSATRGSLWQGDGTLEIATGTRSRAAFAVAWRLDWPALRHAALALELFVDGGPQPLHLAWQGGGVTVMADGFELRADKVAALLPWLAAWAPQGVLRLHTNGLRIAEQAVDGEVLLSWPDAAVATLPAERLGSYAMRLTGRGAVLHGVLTTTDGPLQLAGDGRWAWGERPAFVVRGEVPPALRERLAPIFHGAGATVDGRFEISVR